MCASKELAEKRATRDDHYYDGPTGRLKPAERRLAGAKSRETKRDRFRVSPTQQKGKPKLHRWPTHKQPRSGASLDFPERGSRPNFDNTAGLATWSVGRVCRPHRGHERNLPICTCHIDLEQFLCPQLQPVTRIRDQGKYPPAARDHSPLNSVIQNVIQNPSYSVSKPVKY
jgi:hypothetical protein